MFPRVNANASARPPFTNVNIFQWTDLAPSCLTTTEGPGYFAAKATD